MLEFPMSLFERKQPQEIYDPEHRILISQKFQDSSFLPADNLEHLQQENGNKMDIKFVRTIIHQDNEYSIVTPVKEPSAFGITYIALKNHPEENGKIKYLPIEDMEILIPIHKKNMEQTRLDNEIAENEELSRVMKNLEKINVEFKPRNFSEL